MKSEIENKYCIDIVYNNKNDINRQTNHSSFTNEKKKSKRIYWTIEMNEKMKNLISNPYLTNEEIAENFMALYKNLNIYIQQNI